MTRIKYSHNEIISDLIRVRNIIGRPPSYEDIRKYGFISPASVQRSFNGWANALSAAGFSDPISSWTVDLITPEEGGWLAGFSAGESCFRIAKPSRGSGNGLSHSFNCVFTIQLRSDDMPALEMIRQLWQIDNPVRFWSRDHDRSRGVNAGDGARLSVRDVPTLHYKVVPTFQRYPLRTRKQADFEYSHLRSIFYSSEFQKGDPIWVTLIKNGLSWNRITGN